MRHGIPSMKNPSLTRRVLYFRAIGRFVGGQGPPRSDLWRTPLAKPGLQVKEHAPPMQEEVASGAEHG